MAVPPIALAPLVSSPRTSTIAECGAAKVESAADSMACSLVVADLRQREVEILRRRTASFDPARWPLQRETSTVVLGLVYWSAQYAPPQTADMFWEAVVAYAGGAPRVVHSPADWLALVAPTGWRPTSSEDALLACAEVVAVAGPRSSRLWTPFLYRDAASLSAPDSVSGLPPSFAE